MATAVLTQDICENCSRLGKLETSITGKQKLCKKCMVDQFEYYKQQRLEYCNDMEKVAEFYKQKIGTKKRKKKEANHYIKFQLYFI